MKVYNRICFPFSLKVIKPRYIKGTTFSTFFLSKPSPTYWNLYNTVYAQKCCQILMRKSWQDDNTASPVYSYLSPGKKRLKCYIHFGISVCMFRHSDCEWLKPPHVSESNHHAFHRDANINIQKIGRIQTKNREVFRITCNFKGTKLARNREVAKFGCQNGQKCLQKQGVSLLNRKGWHLCFQN